MSAIVLEAVRQRGNVEAAPLPVGRPQLVLVPTGRPFADARGHGASASPTAIVTAIHLTR